MYLIRALTKTDKRKKNSKKKKPDKLCVSANFVQDGIAHGNIVW